MQNRDFDLEIRIESYGVAIPAQAVHDSRLLVVAHALLKEVGLTPALCDCVSRCDVPFIVRRLNRFRGMLTFEYHCLAA